MKIAKVQFSDDDIDWVDRRAAKHNVSRAEYIRRRVLGGGDGEPRKISTLEYQKLVSDACRRVNVPRSQVDQLVSFVFCELMALPAVEANPD